MSEHANGVDLFERAIGALQGIPDVTASKPTTIRAVMPLVGATQTFIVQTFRHKEQGDTIFIEHAIEGRLIRLVVPPQVANVIARQRDTLIGRQRSKAAKAAMEERMASGWRPSFGGKRGNGGRRKKRRRAGESPAGPAAK